MGAMKQAALRGMRKVIARAARFLGPKSAGPSSFDIKTQWGRGYMERICVDPCGLIRIEGWWEGAFEEETLPGVSLDGAPIPFLQHFRFTRPDVPIGLALEYLVPDALTGAFKILEVTLGGRSFRFASSFSFVTPHYKRLFDSSAVWHRGNIYGSGPPNSVVHPEVFELARRLPAPLLDFGCGKGALLSRLQQIGIEAYGIELFSEGLRAAIIPEVSDRITFYDGSFPTRFEDGQFNSVVCSEVLEHIPNYGDALEEIARITRQSAFFTVPDASAIPAGFRHGVVPWHLLEATHANFFNQTSLTKELRRYFSRVQIGRIGSVYLNDTRTFVSLTALCSK
jgi:ubiquinone/menaquinone biosynthesis C-methylase UbiE